MSEEVMTKYWARFYREFKSSC